MCVYSLFIFAAGFTKSARSFFLVLCKKKKSFKSVAASGVATHTNKTNPCSGGISFSFYIIKIVFCCLCASINYDDIDNFTHKPFPSSRNHPFISLWLCHKKRKRDRNAAVRLFFSF